jgi:hypothetical protein
MPPVPSTIPTNWWLAGGRPPSMFGTDYKQKRKKFFRGWTVINPIKTPEEFYGTGMQKEFQKAKQQQKNQRLMSLTGLGRTNFKNRIKELI